MPTPAEGGLTPRERRSKRAAPNLDWASLIARGSQQTACVPRSQEGIFAELKTDNQLDYVPTRTWVGNQIYLLSVLLAHTPTASYLRIYRTSIRRDRSGLSGARPGPSVPLAHQAPVQPLRGA